MWWIDFEKAITILVSCSILAYPFSPHTYTDCSSCPCVTAVICSLNAVRDNIQDLETLDLTVIVVDEVHKLKDVTKGFAKAFRRFPSVLRYGLTGTAIQNRLEEFRAILESVNILSVPPSCHSFD